jgi:hypothetical protein
MTFYRMKGFSGRRFLLATFCVHLLFIQGCASARHYDALPSQLESEVQVPGFHDIRAWGDAHSNSLTKSAQQSVIQERAAHQGKSLPEISALALSGGGSDGAFGAGFLCGWSKTGKRPQFKVVTGISTGALIAPFAFLGPTYDPELKKVYTTISDKTIYEPHNAFSILLSLLNVKALPSMASTEPLAKLIAQEVDLKMLRRIAAEHRRGRRLLVGTTQINAQRLVIWNMGAIANSGSPHALELFHKILLASASLPVSFNPQYFTVKAKNKLYEEMHVDGGVETQVMLYENAIIPFAKANPKTVEGTRPRKLYIIRNQKIYPEWQYVEPQLKYLALRSIDSLTKSQGIGDLFRLYTYAQRDKLQYHLVFIPKSFNEKEKTPFDNAYMRKLFTLGYKLGRGAQSWTQNPPEYNPLVALR